MTNLPLPQAPPDALVVQRAIGNAIKKALARKYEIADPDGLTDAEGNPLSTLELATPFVARCLRVECGQAIYHKLLVALAAEIPGCEPWEREVSFKNVTIYPCHWRKDNDWELVNPFDRNRPARLDPSAPAMLIGIGAPN